MKTPEQLASDVLFVVGYERMDRWPLYKEIHKAIATAIQAEREPLLNLLCRIHRDGGHYLHAHGIEKACADADEIVARLNAYSDEATKPHPNQGEFNSYFV